MTTDIESFFLNKKKSLFKKKKSVIIKHKKFRFNCKFFMFTSDFWDNTHLIWSSVTLTDAQKKTRFSVLVLGDTELQLNKLTENKNNHNIKHTVV
jgi:hypothetical protein